MFKFGRSCILIGRRWQITWCGIKQWKHFVWKGARLNGGGYLYGASPYWYWRIGPFMIQKYM